MQGSPRGLTRVSELLEVPVLLLTAMAWKGHSPDADRRTEGGEDSMSQGFSIAASH